MTVQKKLTGKEMKDNNGERSTRAGGYGQLPAENVNEEVESMLTRLFSMETDDEDGAMELSKFLESSAEKTFPMKVKIIEDPCWQPVIFQTAASYITINCNEELCGSSFSDSETSYMAGISAGCGFVVGDGGAWYGGAEETREWIEREEEGNCLVNAESSGYCDDEMLAKFLGDDVAQAR